MTLDHDTGLYNVHGTVMLWLQQQLTANRPPLVTTVTLRTEMPEEPLQCPRWSAHILGVDDDPGTILGGAVSGGQYGVRRWMLLEVSCWVTRQNNPGWRAQLMQMIDAVTYSARALQATGSAIKIRDFYASSTSPAELAYKITVDSVEVRQPPVDPNPDIERKRVLISFTWVERK